MQVRDLTNMFKNKYSKRVHQCAAVACAALLLLACRGEETQESETVQQITPITATRPVIQDIHIYQLAVGSIEALNAPVVAAEVAGHVRDVYVDVGDEVEVGQLLARLDSESLEITVRESQARIDEIAAMIENQKLTVERMRNLVKIQAQSQDVLDNAETELKAREAQYLAAEAGLAASQYNLSKATIMAPINGVIQRRDVDLGGYVGVGSPLFQLVSLERLQARLNFPETIRSFLSVGQSVLLSIPSRPDETFETRISDIAPMLDPETRAVHVIVEFANPNGWQPGASVDGKVLIETRKQALLVPEVSVVRRPAGQVVYVLRDDRVEEQVVTSGYRQNGFIEIRLGLTREEVIAQNGASFLTDQALIEVVDSPQ